MPGKFIAAPSAIRFCPQPAAHVVAARLRVEIARFQLGQLPLRKLPQRLTILGVIPTDVGHRLRLGIGGILHVGQQHVEVARHQREATLRARIQQLQAARLAFLLGRQRTGLLTSEIKQGLARVELELVIRVEAIVIELVAAAAQRGIQRQAEVIQALRQLRLGLRQFMLSVRQFQVRMAGIGMCQDRIQRQRSGNRYRRTRKQRANQRALAEYSPTRSPTEPADAHCVLAWRL